MFGVGNRLLSSPGITSALPVVGSSQNKNGGSVRSSVAKDTIFLSPPDNVICNSKTKLTERRESRGGSLRDFRRNCQVYFTFPFSAPDPILVLAHWPRPSSSMTAETRPFNVFSLVLRSSFSFACKNTVFPFSFPFYFSCASVSRRKRSRHTYHEAKVFFYRQNPAKQVVLVHVSEIVAPEILDRQISHVHASSDLCLSFNETRNKIHCDIITVGHFTIFTHIRTR